MKLQSAENATVLRNETSSNGPKGRSISMPSVTFRTRYNNNSHLGQYSIWKRHFDRELENTGYPLFIGKNSLALVAQGSCCPHHLRAASINSRRAGPAAVSDSDGPAYHFSMSSIMDGRFMSIPSKFRFWIPVCPISYSQETYGLPIMFLRQTPTLRSCI